MIVIGDFVAFTDDLLGVNDDLFAIANRKDPRCTIWCAAMVNQTTQVAFHGRINHDIIVHTAENVVIVSKRKEKALKPIRWQLTIDSWNQCLDARNASRVHLPLVA
jgi:hypothetical protein